jgi:hypothetical protein
MALSIFEDDDLVESLGYGGRDYDVMIAESRLAWRRRRPEPLPVVRVGPTVEELRETWRARKAALRQRPEVRERERAADRERRRAEGHEPWSRYVARAKLLAWCKRPQLSLPFMSEAA